MLIAGILLGFIKYIPNQNVFTESTMEGLSFLAKIGVILIMFSAGLETDLKQFKSSGLPSILITILGVIFPLGLGFLVASAFNGGFHVEQHQIITNLFYGAILAATSVSITVAALKELGKLNTKVGTSIVAAAILDDIIGVILLSLFISLDKGNGLDGIGISIGKMIGFLPRQSQWGLLRTLFSNIISNVTPSITDVFLSSVLRWHFSLLTPQKNGSALRTSPAHTLPESCFPRSRNRAISTAKSR